MELVALDSVQVVGHKWVLEWVAADLNRCQARIPQEGFRWSDVEGNLFMLTTVAPRAPAGYGTPPPLSIDLLVSHY